jgi:hypothetical protein
MGIYAPFSGCDLEPWHEKYGRAYTKYPSTLFYGGFLPPRGFIEEKITYAGFPLPDVDWDEVYQAMADSSRHN